MSDEWNEITQQFNTLYPEEKKVLRRLIRKILSKGINEGIDLTLKECKNVKGKRILDIGFSLRNAAAELIKRGAEITVLGPTLNKPHHLHTEDEAAKRQYTIEYNDLLDPGFDEDFDIAVALNFFDHVTDPLPYLRKLKLITREKCIMTFSSRFTLQAPVKMLWITTQTLPLRLYTKAEVKRLLSPIFPRLRVKNISAGYHCVASG